MPTTHSFCFILSSRSVTHVIHLRIANVALRHPLYFKYSKLKQTETNAIRVINGFVDDVIHKRRQELIENVNNNESATADTSSDDIGISRKKRTLLDILLQATIDDKPLSDEDIREEVDVFMFGVRESTLIFSMESPNKSYLL